MPSDRAQYIVESDRLLDAGLWDEQRLLMARAVEAFPDMPEFWYRYALGSFHALDDSAADQVRVAVDLGRSDPAILTRSASLMYDLGHYDEAEQYLRSALGQVTETFPLLADMLHLIGKLAIAKGDDTVAEKYLAKAFEADPGSPGFGHFLATLLARQGNRERSLSIIDRALAHDPPDAHLLLDLRRQVIAALDG